MYIQVLSTEHVSFDVNTFSFRVGNNDIQSPKIYFDVTNISLISSTSFSSPLFTSPSLPSTTINYSRSIVSQNNYYCQSHKPGLFTSFLIVSLKPLSYISTLFSLDFHWNLTSIQSETAFYLIYNGIYTLNVLLIESSYFQIIVPSIGQSSILSIPLSLMPKECILNKLSHYTLRISSHHLVEMKHLIEHFYYRIQSIQKHGFQISSFTNLSAKFELKDQIHNLALIAECSSHSISLYLQASNRNDITKYMSEIIDIFNNPSLDPEHHIPFIIALLRLSNSKSILVLKSIHTLFMEANDSQFNWDRIINDVSMTPSEFSFSYHIHDDIYSIVFRFDETIRISIFQNGDILRDNVNPKSLRVFDLKT